MILLATIDLLMTEVFFVFRLYEGNHDDPEDDRPHYVAMKPLTGNHMKQYDSPFIVPIPLSDDIPNYESILAQMIECKLQIIVC